MEDLPQQLTPRPGREYSFREILRRGIGALGRNWGRALLLGLMLVAVDEIARFSFRFTWRAVWEVFSMSSSSSGPSELSKFVAQVASNAVFFPFQALSIMLWAGFTWAIVKSFQDGKLRLGDAFTPWRSPWLGRMVLYALAYAGISFVLSLTGAGLLAIMSSASGGSSPHLITKWGIILTFRFLHALMWFLLFLVPYIMLSGNRPRLFSALGMQLRLIRNQPGRLLAIAAIVAIPNMIFSLAPSITLDIGRHLTSSPEVWMPYYNFVSISSRYVSYGYGLLSAFLLAAFVASIFGMLERHEAAASPPPWGTPIRPARLPVKGDDDNPYRQPPEQ